VRGRVGHVGEEGCVPHRLGMVVDEADRRVVDGVGVVEGLVRLGFVGDVVVVAGEGLGREEAAGAGDGAEVAVEPALAGPVVFLLEGLGAGGVRHVPLAGHIRAVACGLERLGQGDALAVDVAPVAGQLPVRLHAAHAGLVGVESREQLGAGRAAACAVVKLGEPNALGREGVEVGGLDLAPVATDVGEAHVVGHDEDHVRPRAGARRRGDQGRQAARQQRPGPESDALQETPSSCTCGQDSVSS